MSSYLTDVRSLGHDLDGDEILEKFRELREVEKRERAYEAEAGSSMDESDRTSLKLRAELIEANLPLVIYLVGNTPIPTSPPVDKMDLISGGNVGLSIAVDKFDPSYGIKFSTYACHRIRREIRKAVNSFTIISVPWFMRNRLWVMEKATQEFLIEHLREPSTAELMEKTGFTRREIKAATLAKDANVAISLDASIGDNDGTMGDMMMDPDIHDRLESDSFFNDNWPILREVMSGLPDRERTIMEKRYGIGCEEPMTLEKIGREFGITRERVRQIQEKTEELLRRGVSKTVPIDDPLAIVRGGLHDDLVPYVGNLDDETQRILKLYLNLGGKKKVNEKTIRETFNMDSDMLAKVVGNARSQLGHLHRTRLAAEERAAKSAPLRGYARVSKFLRIGDGIPRKWVPLLRRVTAAELDVIQRRHGLGGHKPHTIASLARHFKLANTTMERVLSHVEGKLEKASERATA